MNTTNSQSGFPGNQLVRDLTRAAREEGLAPSEGRRKEISELVDLLKSESTRRILVLGERGTGKTTLVEAAATALAKEEPASSVSIVEFDAGALSADTIRVYEQGHELLASLKNDRNLILFIEDVTQFLLQDAPRSKGVTEFYEAIASARISVVAALDPQCFDQITHQTPDALADFHVVKLQPLTGPEAMALLQKLKAGIQASEGIRISTAALRTAVKLSVKFLPERKLPGIAIEVLYRACGRYKTKSDLKVVDEEWLDEESMRFLGKKVSSHDVTRVVEEMSGRDIDAELVATWEKQVLQRLQQSVFGQPDAIAAAAAAVARMQIAFGSQGRAAGAFLFMGPKGVGKTHTARTIGAGLVSSKKDTAIFDLALYGSPESMQRLLGRTRTLGGSFLDGDLSRAVLHARRACVIFENVEQAHPDFMNALDQIIQSGELSYEDREKVSFHRCILFLIAGTPGAEIAQSGPPRDPIGLASEFLPETVVRGLDAAILFAPLNEGAAREIVHDRFERFGNDLAKRQVAILVKDNVHDVVIDKGFNQQTGASGINRLLRKVVFNPVDELLRNGKVGPGATLQLSASKGKISIRVKHAKAD